MIERSGDLWAYPSQATVAPTNLQTKSDGTAVMGAGVAKQAADRWPFLPAILGDRYCQAGPGTYVVWTNTMARPVVCFPTKRRWKDPADLDLIEQSARELVLPRVGAGLGRRDWTEIEAMLSVLLDDRFVVVTPEEQRKGSQHALTASTAPKTGQNICPDTLDAAGASS